MGGLFGILGRRWRRLPRFWQNMLVGLGIALSLPLLRHTEWVDSAQNLAMDTMIQLNAALPRMSAPARGRPSHAFTLLDIDEKSYRSWNEPYHIPRDKLQGLVRFALEGGARLVVVDVNLNNPGVDKTADAALLHYLESLTEAERGKLVLLRLTAPPDIPGRPPAYETLRATIVDALPPQKTKGINWAHPYFKKDQSDGVVRRWALYLKGCFAGRPTVLPSVQLMAAMVLGPAAERQALTRKFQRLLPASCADLADRVEKRSKARRWLVAYGYDLAAKGLTERILYTMPYAVAGQDGHQAMSPDLAIIPAHLITESATPPATDAVRGRVVFIGASYAASHDLHMTPLGLMPGVMILANASKSLLVLGPITPPGPLVVWPLLLALIVFMSLAFSYFRKLTATVIINAVVILVLMPISYFLFRYGIWFDFAAPLLGMQVHQIVAEFNRGR